MAFAIGDKVMRDHEKTREQLIAELEAIREKMSELEQSQSRLTDSENYLQDVPQTMSRFLDVEPDPDVEIATDDIAKFIISFGGQRNSGTAWWLHNL